MPIANIKGVTLQHVQRILTLMGIWAGFGLVLWLLVKLWPTLRALSG